MKNISKNSFNMVIDENTNKMLSTGSIGNSKYHKYVVESGMLK